MIKDSQTKELIENPKGYKVLVYISMFYMSIMLCNAILTNRYIGNDTLFVLGGAFTSPLVFILDDIIAEMYAFGQIHLQKENKKLEDIDFERVWRN